MIPAEIEQTLAQIETFFDSVSEAIRCGEPSALVVATSGLRNAAIDLSRLLDRTDVKAISDSAFKHRVNSLSEGFAIQRENLIRRSVPVDQALNIIVPASRASTYQPSPSQYSNGHRQSGEFDLIKV